jgi:Tfp pilus assembly protein FimV
MTATKWIELAQNKLGAPVSCYPELALKEYEQRIQDVVKILNEVKHLIKEKNNDPS